MLKKLRRPKIQLDIYASLWESNSKVQNEDAPAYSPGKARAHMRHLMRTTAAMLGAPRIF